MTSIVPKLKSTNAEMPATLTVRNHSDARVSLYWYNYQGETEFFSFIEQGESYTLDSHLGHSFLITGDDEEPRNCFTLCNSDGMRLTLG